MPDPSDQQPAAPPRPDSGEASGLLQAIIDALPMLVFVKDAEELRLLFVNQTAAAAFGMAKDELLGKVDHEYFPKELADAFVAIDREVLASGQMKVMDEIARAYGKEVHVLTRKLPIVDAQGRKYLLGIAEDVTARKAQEEALRRSKEELEAANARLEANLVELKRTRALSAKTIASYQQRALQMEIIRQQNEDLDRLAQDLARAKHLEEQRAREIEQAARLKSEFLAN
ncbi:MAG TPA: PAS domain-containing protein, partial [Minicystis sp.]|nr:PAS domain-containing protein [Minicystis sp.]